MSKEIGSNFLFFLLVVVLYSALGFFYYPDKAFSPDSWAYIELAKTFFNDTAFYALTTTRSFFDDGYSASFPLFYPLILAVLSSLFEFDVFNGVLLNIIVALTTPFIAGLWLKRIGSSFDVGFIAGLFLLLYFPYQTEIFAARSIPLAILLFIAALYTASFIEKFDGTHSSLTIFLAGLLLGLAVLTRFDYLYVVLGSVLLIIFHYKLGIKHSILLFLSVLFSFSPWVFYSIFRFDVLLASDNSWVFLGVEKYFVMDLIDKSLYQSLFQDPLGWTLKVISNIPQLFINFSTAIIVFSAPLLLVLFFIKKTKKRKKSYFNFKIGVMSLSLLQIGVLLGVGYFDHRYFSLFILMGYVIMFHLVISSISIRPQKIKFLVVLSFGFVYIVSIFMNARFTTTTNYEKNVSLNTLVEDVSYCSDKVGAQYHFFNDDTFAAKFGAITGKRTVMIPSNWNDLSDIEQKRFGEKYSIYLYVDINEYQNDCSMQLLPKVVTK